MEPKGFMHALESIIAAMLLLTYAAAVFHYPQSQSDWGEIKQKQVSMEYMSSFNDAGLSRLIVENRPSEFMEITRNFLGVRYSYGLYTEGLVPQNLVIGVLSNESVEIPTNPADCAVEGVPSDNGWCRNATFKGIKFILTDNDTGEGNGIEDYDSIYFDSNNNGVYDIFEGPRSVSNVINVSGEMWIFSSIDNGTSTYEAEFIRAEDVLRYSRKISDLKINNRHTNISIRARTNESDISDLDVLIIPRYMNLVGIKSKLNRFLDEKKSIIEVANITVDNFDEVQEEIFGLQLVDIDTVQSSERNISLRSKNGADSAYDIEKYFYFTNMKIESSVKFRKMNMSWINNGPEVYDYNCYLPDSGIYLGYVNCTNLTSPDPCTAYDVDGIVDYVNSTEGVYCRVGSLNSPDVYYYAEIDIRKKNYSALIANSAGFAFDTLFVDLDRDRNLSDDGGGINAGDIFKIEATNFTLRQINEDGEYFEIRPVSEHMFADTSLGKLYSVHNGTEYIILEQTTEYNSTALSIGDRIEVNNLLAGRGSCTEGLLSGTDYKYNNTWALPSPFTITNISKHFNVLNVDLNGNNVCNDLNEGPFYTGDLVRVGPEYYQIGIAEDGSQVNWTLFERWAVPSAIVNHKKGLRKTAWLGVNIESDDEWHILQSIILWSIDQKSYLVKSSVSSESVVVKSTFIENRDMFQPYKVYLRTG